MTTFWLIFAFVVAFGACVGSFLNVVIFRLPNGQNIVSPPSACPECGHKLAWHDNVPVLGWLWLRGKCRYCANPISIQYPIIEAITAMLFAGLFLAYYCTGLRPPFTEHGLIDETLGGTWPVLIVHLFLVGSLLAATMIDAKYYLIPLSIPWLATAVAMIALPTLAAIGWLPPDGGAVSAGRQITDHLVPIASRAGVPMVLGGGVGLILAIILLRLKLLPVSFADEQQYLDQVDVQNTAEVVNAYPHSRREMFKELMFVALPLLGVLLGMTYAVRTVATAGDEGPWFAQLPLWADVLAGVFAGYLTGAGLVWFTRILGTLAFGKEAMGLGDVHLLAAVGAVIGPLDTVLAFFVAPFMGLATYAVMLIIGSRGDEEGVRIIPYGPFLAGGAVVVMVFRNDLLFLLGF